MATSSGKTSDAQKNWELANEIQTIEEGVLERIYCYDNNAHQAALAAKPWSQDPHYFKKIHISAVALLKMTTHAKFGGNIEVMGLTQGKILDNSIYIMDAFALPVEGTETRVNAQTEAYEYMVEYMMKSKEVMSMASQYLRL